MLPKRIIKFISIAFLFLNFITLQYVIGQKITLDETIDAALKNSKINNQYNLINNSSNVERQGIKKQNLPAVTWNTQGSLQSENIELNLPIPNINPISLPLYKFQSDVSANYLFYDGGMTNSLISIEDTKEKLNSQSIDVQLYGIKNQIVELYYSILLSESQYEIIDSSITMLEIKKRTLNSLYKNGVILKSDIDKLNNEIIKLEQSKESAFSQSSTIRKVLSDITGLDFSNLKLSKSDIEETIDLSKNDRPELELFNLKRQLLQTNSKLTEIKNNPKVGLFAKAGVAYPNPFNFFKNKISPFAIGGVNFTWNIWDWKRTEIDRQKLKIQSEVIDNQEEIFNENIKTESDRLKSEIAGLEKNYSFDEKIVKNQIEITNTVENQYKNGVATINDLLTELTNNNIALLKIALHNTELSKAKSKLKILLNQK